MDYDNLKFLTGVYFCGLKNVYATGNERNY